MRNAFPSENQPDPVGQHNLWYTLPRPGFLIPLVRPFSSSAMLALSTHYKDSFIIKTALWHLLLTTF